jgi:MbtH protein
MAEEIYKVLVNDEEQYTICPLDRETPRGWKDAGKTGSRDECMQYIDEVWTDMRPKSLRDRMSQEAERGG